MKKKNNKPFYLRIESLSSVVTGSCNYCTLHLPNKQEIEFLVDCGMFFDEGMDEYNSNFLFEPSKISFSIATHYHADHTGRFAMLYNQGYEGLIYASEYTTEHIKKHAIANWYAHKKSSPELLWNENDAIKLINNVKALKNNVILKVHPNIDIIFFKNAHCRGAIMCIVRCKYEEETINVLFTGDYKEKSSICKSWISDSYKESPITIVTEATYGIESKPEETFDKLVTNAIQEEGNVLIFGLGNEMFEHIITRIKQLKRKGKIDSDIPIYVEINRKFEMNNKVLRSMPSNVTFVKTVTEKTIALYDKKQKIIIVTERGGIDFFLPFMVKKENNMIIFTNHMRPNSNLLKFLNSSRGQYISYRGKEIEKLAQVYNTEEFGCHCFIEEVEKLVDFFENTNAIVFGHGDKCAKQEVVSHFNKKLKDIQGFYLRRGKAFRVTADGVKYE